MNTVAKTPNHNLLSLIPDGHHCWPDVSRIATSSSLDQHWRPLNVEKGCGCRCRQAPAWRPSSLSYSHFGPCPRNPRRKPRRMSKLPPTLTLNQPINLGSRPLCHRSKFHLTTSKSFRADESNGILNDWMELSALRQS